MELRYGGMRFQLCGSVPALWPFTVCKLMILPLRELISSEVLQRFKVQIGQCTKTCTWADCRHIQISGWESLQCLSLLPKGIFLNLVQWANNWFWSLDKKSFIQLLKLHLKRLNHHPCPTARQGKCQLRDYRHPWAGFGVSWHLLDLEKAVEATVVAKASC